LPTEENDVKRSYKQLTLMVHMLTYFTEQVCGAGASSGSGSNSDSKLMIKKDFTGFNVC
jgi:hypothetical protein